MKWPLTERVAATRVGADLVFLDLETDQYSCLPSQSELVLEGRQVSAGSLDAVRPLIDEGLLGLRPASGESRERLPPNCPIHDLHAPPAARIPAGELYDFVASWAEALTRLPGRSLLALHKQVRDQRPGSPEVDLEGVVRRVAAFEALLPWVPFPGACLFRSYLLLRFLQRGGYDARWIVGVRTWPFEAHCWLQISDIALDDRCEHLVRFQPLLGI